MANANQATVSIINTATNIATSVIQVNAGVDGEVITSPDGSLLYVANNNFGLISIINTSTNAVVDTIHTGSPSGISLSADGSYLYVTNQSSNTLSVINTATKKVVATIPVGKSPNSFGNFVEAGGCSGTPVIFTITVDPSPPLITAGTASGIISACVGTASASPDVEQFSVAGSGLSANIAATAPIGFEVSLSPVNGYGNSVTLVQNSGAVNGTIIYVRSAAADGAGNISGNVALTSTGASNVNVAISGIVNALPTTNGAADQELENGSVTAGIDFTGTANTYTWVNDTPGIGLAASGTGNIASFTAANTGSAPVTATITVTPVNAGFAYIANFEDGTMSVINTITKSVISNFSVGSTPLGVSVSPDGSRVYVTNSGTNTNTVSVINTATNTVLAIIPVGTSPWGICTSPDGSLVYVANKGANTVSVINTASNIVINTISVGVSPWGVCESHDGSAVYVTNGTNNISIINTANNMVAGNITLNAGAAPQGICISPDDSKLYVANGNLGSVSVVDIATKSVVASCGVGSFPYGICISPDGSRVYVANANIGGVTVINTATNTVVTTIEPNTSPESVSISQDGSLLYIVHTDQDAVSVVNTATNALEYSIPVGSGPSSMGNFLVNGSGCSGLPSTFTITVNPSPSLIIAGTATGYISSCVGSASASPDIEQFKVTANGLTGNLIATAPFGFEVSLAAGSGYGNSVLLTPSGGTINSTVVYVRSSAADAQGNISGNVVLTSSGAGSQNVAVTGIVNVLPTIGIVANQNLTAGAATGAVNFVGTANTFTWVNDTPGIGLAASGSGNIASFTAINTGNTPIRATITATPINAGFAYIANENSNTISVINTTTNTVVADLKAGSNPFGVSVSPDGSAVYVGNYSSGNVSVINTATLGITTIPVGLNPEGVAVSPDGSTLYVANNGSNNVSVINIATNAATTIAVGRNPGGLCLSADGSMLYVANENSNTVSVITTANNTATGTILVGTYPQTVAVSPDGSKLYVSNFYSNGISVISTVTSQVITTIPVGTGPTGLVVSPDGSRVYAVIHGTVSVSVIDAGSNTVIASIPVGVAPEGISLNQDGSLLYVTGEGSNNVTVVNTTTNAVVTSITVDAAPSSLGNFIKPGMNCSGTPTSFTITVNPAATAAAISASAVSGTIAACFGNASASPDIESFTVTGSGLSGNITATAPPGFDISLTEGNGYGSSVSLTPTSGTVNNTIVYVRSSASDPPGNISGNVVLTSAVAASINVPVAGTINALPVINAVSNQTVKNNTATLPVNFTGTGNTFTWTNDTPAIGLAASGSGNIAAFTATNSGSTQVTATITATPLSAGFAYISSSNSNNVSVINTVTNTIVATIKVGLNPGGVSVSRDGTRVYVTNETDNTVSVIDATNNTVVATIPVGIEPFCVAVSPDGSRAYVSNYTSNTVSVINTAINKVISTIPTGTSPYGVAVSPDGSHVYVANLVSKSVTVINTANNSTITSVGVGGNPCGVTISTDGSRVYVANSLSNNVSVINTATNLVVATIPLEKGPVGITVSPDGGYVYTADQESDFISVINTATNTEVASIPDNGDPFAVSTSPDGSLLYVTNLTGTVSVINTATNVLITNISVGLNLDPVGNFVTGGTNCGGTPITFTITVDPTATTAAQITASAISGSISACAGTASASPYIEQFAVSGTGLTGNITATAPAGFEVSLNPGSGYGVTASITPFGSSVNSIVIYVRSNSNSPGMLTSDVVLTTAGAPTQNVPVTASINALPTINAGSSQAVTNGGQTTAIDFTGTANTFTWTNDTPAIGLAGSGTGNIAPFTAINTGTTSVTATITATPMSVAYAYITNQQSNNVSVINLATNTVITNIPVGKAPTGVTISPNGKYAYITNQNDNTVSVISTATNTVVSTFAVHNFSPTGIAISLDGSKAYVADDNSNLLSVTDLSTGNLITTVGVGGYPLGVAISPDGSTVYVTNSSNSVSVVKTATNSVLTTILVSKGPYGVVISPDGNTLYVTNYSANTVSVINTATNKVTATIAVGSDPTGIAISPDGSTVYVTNQNDNSVSVINTTTNTVSAIAVNSDPFGVSVSSDGQTVYVVNNKSNNVSVIDAATDAIVATIPVNSGPESFGNFITAGSGCNGTPSTFTIIVDPTGSTIPTIAATGVLLPLNTIYGTPSATTTFTVSGTNTTAGILVTPPPGFEVSADGINYGNTVNIGGAGSIAATTVYLRLAATTPVGDDYSGNIVLTSTGAADVIVPTALSTVSPAPLTITADNKSKGYGTENPVLTFTYSGFVNNETFTVLTAQPEITTTANTLSLPGKYPITVDGAAAANYTFIYIQGILTITPGAAIALVVPNTFTPNGDGINDTWDIKNIENFPNCTVDIYNRWGEKLYSSIGYPIPWDGKYKGTYLPTGTYYYIINPKNGLSTIAGFIAIIR